MTGRPVASPLLRLSWLARIRRRSRRLRLLVLAIALASLQLVILSAPAPATERYDTNTIPADLNDPFAYTVNPALGEMTLDQVAAGYRLLHLGLLEQSTDLHTGRLVYAGKRRFGGLSIDLGYLTTPLWEERELGAGWGKRIWRGLSLGAAAGFNQRGFVGSAIDVADPGDPLMAASLTKTVPTTRFALAWTRPLWGVTAGFVLENPHEPNVSFSDDETVVLAQTWRLGLGYEGHGVQVAAGLIDDEFDTHPSGSARVLLLGGNALTARFGQRSWALGARLVVNRELFVDYEFSLPRSDLANETAGSHGIAICYQPFGRPEPVTGLTHRDPVDHDYQPDLSAPRSAALPTAKSFSLPLLTAKANHLLTAKANHFCVQAPVDTALIRIKRLKRSFSPLVDMAQIRQLPRWRIGVLDTTWSDRVAYSIAAQAQPARPDRELPRGNYSAAYMRNVRELGEQLQTATGTSVTIVADAEQLDRAAYLAGKLAGQSEVEYTPDTQQIGIYQLPALDDRQRWHRLNRPVGQEAIPAVEEITLYQFERVPFIVHTFGPRDRVAAWTWTLRDSDGATVRTIAAAAAPPDTIWWDWRNERGEIVAVDSYSYQFSWRHPDGTHSQLPPQPLQVARQVIQRSLVFGNTELPPEALQRGETMLLLDPGSRTGRSAAPASSHRDDTRPYYENRGFENLDDKNTENANQTDASIQ